MISWAPLALLLVQGAKPASSTLADYLRTANVERALVVAPESISKGEKGEGLAAFGRKAVPFGTLQAIVPTTRVAFDDRPHEIENPYDGLPRSTKVLYLMTLLTPAQWSRANGLGLGANDLQGEARAVFLSILPEKLAWTKYRTNAYGKASTPLGKGLLQGEKARAVRLRIERKIGFEVPLQRDPEDFTDRESDSEDAPPGESCLKRVLGQDDRRLTPPLVNVRSMVPNGRKPGQLATDQMNTIVNLPARTTVGEALGKVGAVTGREILADLRVRDLSVFAPTDGVRAGDLLDALALAVGGTFRKVGGAFLLAADLTGLGARKLRLSIEQARLGDAVRILEDRLRLQAGQAGAIERIGYGSDDPLAPGAALRKRLADPKANRKVTMASTDEFSPAQKAFIARETLEHPTMRVRTDRAHAYFDVAFRFVLPSGEALVPEASQLGRDFQFFPKDSDQPPTGPNSGKTTIPKDALRPLLVRTDAASETVFAVRSALAFGFSELWLETSSSEALGAAVEGKLPVRLVVRPWRLGAGSEPDRTILGETGSAGVRRLEEIVRGFPLESWIGYLYGPTLAAGPSLDRAAPVGAASTMRFSHWRALAATPGLAGVVVTDSQPHGYEPKAAFGSTRAYPRHAIETWALGYSEAMRLAFLRAKGVDPIDLAEFEWTTATDLRPPFFLDDALRPMPTTFGDGDEPDSRITGLWDEWRAYRADANERAIRGFLESLPSIPVLVDLRRETNDRTIRPYSALFPWRKGWPLPASDETYTPQAAGIHFLVPIPGPKASETPIATDWMREAPLGFDLSALAPADWASALARWFERPASKG